MIIKKKVDSWSPAIWPIFNIIFIAGMQISLLLLISAPAYIQLLVTNMGMEISRVDTLFPRALVGLVLIEALADHQQWSLYPQFVLVNVDADIYLCSFPKRKGEIQGHCQSPSRSRARRLRAGVCRQWPILFVSPPKLCVRASLLGCRISMVVLQH